MELFHKILNTAVEGGASDVHIKPDAPVVYRISSQLVEAEMSQQPDEQWLGNVINNIVPTQFKPKLDEDREIDFSYNVPGIGRFRTNCFQHLGKWCLAMRHVVADVPKIDSLGLPEIIKSIAEEHRGIVLVAGTTGCGKSTTLAGMIDHINSTQKRHIITIEDPVEYVFKDKNCIIEQREVGLDTPSYQHSLKHVMRQDPDVIMIGEMRDLETARIAIQSALTGHLVLSTLHTNDAVSAVNRLVDMGVEPFLLASSLLGVLAQRLVRRLCPPCKQPDPTAPGAWRPVGCAQCNQVGYSGRTGIHELFYVDDAVRGLIHQGAGEQDLRVAACRAGMFSLREDGERWVRSGTTAPEEILRVTRDAG